MQTHLAPFELEITNIALLTLEVLSWNMQEVSREISQAFSKDAFKNYLF